jgi:hypothetical protein
MTARHFAEKVQKDYIRYVENFTAFLGRSPETATSEDLRLALKVFDIDSQRMTLRVEQGKGDKLFYEGAIEDAHP